jgi:glucose/arabinose dehydrogenase
MKNPGGGAGGAILPLKGEIIYASTSGLFYRINLATLQYEENYLPKLKNGIDFFDSSIQIKTKEISPRVLDIAFNNNIFYVTHERYDSVDDSLRFVISKIKKTDSEWTDLYVSPKLDVNYFAMGDGGKMAVKGNKLYFTVGDFSLDRINGLPSDVAAQNPNLPWGKINYINLENGIFNHYALGFRNPKGLLFLKSGKLLSTDNGPQGGDEINLIKEGKNYGWPYESFGMVYGESFAKYKDSLPKPIEPKQESYVLPIFSFVPSISPTAIVQIKNFDLYWDGDLLIGSLNAMSLFHIKLNGEHVIYSEPIFLGKRIRDLRQLNKQIIALTDDKSIIFINKN